MNVCVCVCACVCVCVYLKLLAVRAQGSGHDVQRLFEELSGLPEEHLEGLGTGLLLHDRLLQRLATAHLGERGEDRLRVNGKQIKRN